MASKPNRDLNFHINAEFHEGMATKGYHGLRIPHDGLVAMVIFLLLGDNSMWGFCALSKHRLMALTQVTTFIIVYSCYTMKSHPWSWPKIAIHDSAHNTYHGGSVIITTFRVACRHPIFIPFYTLFTLRLSLHASFNPYLSYNLFR